MNTTDLKAEIIAAIAKVLSDFASSPNCRVDDLAKWAGVSRAQMYRYLSGDMAIGSDALGAIKVLCCDDDLRLALFCAEAPGCGIRHLASTDGGGASSRAVISNVFNAIHSAAKFAQKAEAAVFDNRVTQSELVDIRMEKEETVRALDAAMDGAEKMAVKGGAR